VDAVPLSGSLSYYACAAVAAEILIHAATPDSPLLVAAADANVS